MIFIMIIVFLVKMALNNKIHPHQKALYKKALIQKEAVVFNFNMFLKAPLRYLQ